MKKKLFFCLSLVLLIPGFIFFYYKNKKTEIDNILKKESYAYLPEEAQKYIKQVYEETDEVVLTEKNKEENEPYLNPKYIEYLELSDEEKAKVELIPDVYVLDYEVNKSYSGSKLPSTYDLRNIDGKNYVSTIKNQGSTSICWAFASVENVETLLMKQKGQSYSDVVPKFSIRQMDYATSTNRLIKYFSDIGTVSCTPIDSCSHYVYENPDNGSRELGKGGNFYTSSIVMANGLSLVDESVLPWNEDDHTYWPKDIFNYDNSKYEVDSTIQLASINEDSASKEVIDSYVADVKNYMMQYGGPFVGTYSPTSTCGFTNTDGIKAMKTDDCINDTKNKDLGHAMQIIGWDDDYSYSYCENGTNHGTVQDGNCNTGELKTGKGAWILRNSWGTETTESQQYSYVYLTYDSTRLSIGFTTSLSEMENRSWDNNYHANPWIDSSLSKGMASVNEQSEEFDIHNNKSEKIEKIKFLTATKNGKFNLSIITDDNEYNNITVINSNEVGIYTIDLSDKNIIIDSGKFTIKIVSDGDGQFYNNSISVFTSNVESTPSVTTYSSLGYDSTKPLSDENPLYVHGGNYWFLTVNTYLKNIPSNADLTYRIKKDDGVIATERQIADFRKTIINDVGEAYFDGSYSSSNAKFSTADAYGKTYTFEVVYGDIVVDSFPIKFSGNGATTKSNVRLHANNGTDYYYTTTATDKSSVKFNDISSLQTANFYNDGYYIVGWNTQADGKGTNYSVTDDIKIYKDTDLYAQWSTEKLKVVLTYDCQEYGSCYNIDGTMQNETHSLDDKITLPANNYTREGYVFNDWCIKRGSSLSDCFYEEITTSFKISDYANYPVFNNTKVNVYARWIEDTNYYTVTFNSNDGTGNMLPINLKKYLYGTNLLTSYLKANKFTKDGYSFAGWNTQADGKGTSYSDKGSIKSESNVTLYAQWQLISNIENSTTDYETIYNGNKHTININVDITEYTIKYSKDGITYNLTEIPKYKDVGEYTIYYKISKSGYEDLISSNKVKIYGIKSTSLELKNNIIITKLNTNIDSIKNNINVFGNIIYEHYNKSGTSQTSSNLITGDLLKLKINNNIIAEYQISSLGDVNSDGKISSADYVKLRKHIMGSEIINAGVYYYASDVNKDNKISSADYVKIRKYIMNGEGI